MSSAKTSGPTTGVAVDVVAQRKSRPQMQEFFNAEIFRHVKQIKRIAFFVCKHEEKDGSEKKKICSRHLS